MAMFSMCSLEVVLIFIYVHSPWSMRENTWASETRFVMVLGRSWKHVGSSLSLGSTISRRIVPEPSLILNRWSYHGGSVISWSWCDIATYCSQGNFGTRTMIMSRWTCSLLVLVRYQSLSFLIRIGLKSVLNVMGKTTDSRFVLGIFIDALLIGHELHIIRHAIEAFVHG